MKRSDDLLPSLAPLLLPRTATTHETISDDDDDVDGDGGGEGGRSVHAAVAGVVVSLPTGPVRRVFLRHLDATAAAVVEPRQLEVPAGKEKTKHFHFFMKNC